MAKLTSAELDTALRDLPMWRVQDGKVTRDYEFRDFAEAMVFVNQVAGIAESADHHPDIDIRYNKVRLALISHDTGGITRRDVSMASRIDEDSAARL